MTDKPCRFFYCKNIDIAKKCWYTRQNFTQGGFIMKTELMMECDCDDEEEMGLRNHIYFAEDGSTMALQSPELDSRYELTQQTQEECDAIATKILNNRMLAGGLIVSAGVLLLKNLGTFAFGQGISELDLGISVALLAGAGVAKVLEKGHMLHLEEVALKGEAQQAEYESILESIYQEVHNNTQSAKDTMYM